MWNYGGVRAFAKAEADEAVRIGEPTTNAVGVSEDRHLSVKRRMMFEPREA
jgi:hypothetical protein